MFTSVHSSLHRAALAVRGIRRRRQIGASQNTIEFQIKAFQPGDGAPAYSFASPTIQGMFPTVDLFMGMVRSGYQPVRNPDRCLRQGSGTCRRPVCSRCSHRPGRKEYEARYSLELQPDGVWRINSVHPAR